MEITSNNPGAEKALRLFRDAAARVPAYKDFLKRHSVRPASIKSAKDFALLPVTDAKNYIAAYPVKSRCWDGRLPSAQLIATSSGTTGEPKFWPRNAEQDTEAVRIHHFLYNMYFCADKKTTLFLIGFPMGVYVSGMATLLPTWLSSLKVPGWTVMSVGNNKAEMLRAVRHLSADYEQTILIGHPFFIKDVLETGTREGISWASKRLGLMFCSEGFSEAWREYVGKLAGIKPSSMRIFNTYGSSEMLLMAYETPFSIVVKKMAERDGNFLKALTGEAIPPQFFQYDPLLRYIESIESPRSGKELIFTSASGIPLIRFNIHDRGDVYTLREVRKAAGNSLKDKPSKPWPLVALWGRSDQTVIFYAANIYPEHIKLGLGATPLLKKLTGKFAMQKGSYKNLDEFLEINIELQAKMKLTKALQKNIEKMIVRQLERANMEYKFLREHLDKDIVPRVKLWPYQHEKYFKPGLKPRYILHK